MASQQTWLPGLGIWVVLPTSNSCKLGGSFNPSDTVNMSQHWKKNNNNKTKETHHHCWKTSKKVGKTRHRNTTPHEKNRPCDLGYQFGDEAQRCLSFFSAENLKSGWSRCRSCAMTLHLKKMLVQRIYMYIIWYQKTYTYKIYIIFYIH